MIERGQRLRFACEPGEAIGIAGEGIGQNLQRHVPIELGVPRAIDLAHPACPDLGEDFIGAETGA